ncbi:Core-2/I-Branching enzyme [Cooperia oncophora]
MVLHFLISDEYIKTIAKQRPNLRRSRGISCEHYNDCNHIRTKVTAQRNFKPLPFGVAYARVVYENYDVMMKSVYETVSILEAMDGTNDILVKECEPERWDHSTKWDTRSLGLFRDGTSQNALAKMSTLTRDTVDWMLNTVKLTKLINQLNTNKHAVDEILLASLAATAQLEMPGRSSTSCLKANRESDPTPYFTRCVTLI